MKDEIIFLKKLFQRLEQKQISYCILRNANEIIRGDAHDIDMVVDFICFPQVCECIKEVSGSEWKVHFVANKDNGNLITVHLYRIDEEYPILVHFDFFQNFGWNGYKLITNSQLLKERNRKEWLYEAALPIQAVTMLFSRYLYHGYIKEKYRDFIQEVFHSHLLQVKNIMLSFMSKEFVDCIVDDVISGEWENIEQEYSVVLKNVVDVLEEKQKHLREEMLLFNLKRLQKCTGLVVGMAGSNDSAELHTYASKVQEILCRTFSKTDVFEKYEKVVGGGIKQGIGLKLKNRINLSKGKLIFTNDLYPQKDKVVIMDIQKIPPTKAAIMILKAMARRYE